MAPLGIMANVAENALGLRRQRQQTDGDVGLAEERRELMAAVEEGNLCGRPR